MKKKLRIISLAMLVAAIIFVIFAFLTMDVPINLPISAAQLRIFYKLYLIAMAGIFAVSFLVKNKK